MSDATCSLGHVQTCGECYYEAEARLALEQRRAVVAELWRRAEGRTWVWRNRRHNYPDSKAHLLTCAHAAIMIDSVMAHDGPYPSSERYIAELLNEFTFTDHYPGDIPICSFCEGAGA